MTHYGTLRDYRFTGADETADDVRGSKVYGRATKNWAKLTM